MTFRLSIVGRLALALSVGVFATVAAMLILGPGAQWGIRIVGAATMLAYAALAVSVFRSKMAVRPDGIAVRNPLGKAFVPWSEFDDFVIRRWWIYPYTLHVQTKNGALIHVFVRALGLAYDPDYLKEELFRLRHAAIDLARSG